MAISSVLGSSALLPAGLGFRNLIINGGMQVDQRATAVVDYDSGYTVDRWHKENQTANGVTVATNADVPTGQGFTASLRATCTYGGSAGFSPIYLAQKIEGLNSAYLAFGTAGAKTVTLSFWVRSSVVGLHSITLLNSAANRSYAASYTISAANTWEKKTITIPGDTTGTWLTTNGVGLEVRFNLQLPSFSVGAGNTWTANSYQGVTGTVNDLATTGNIFAITGVQLEQNYQPTPFEQRPIGVELGLCQRYYEDSVQTVGVTGSYATGLGGNTYFSATYFKVTKRISPSATNGASETPGNIQLIDNDGIAGGISLYRAGWTRSTIVTTDWKGTWGFTMTSLGSITDAAMGAFRFKYSAEL